jgi:hypothetical protein
MLFSTSEHNHIIIKYEIKYFSMFQIKITRILFIYKHTKLKKTTTKESREQQREEHDLA